MTLNNVTMRSLFQDVKYRVARTRSELEQAYRLVYLEYLNQGYVSPSSSGLRMSIHNALPGTTTFVAVVDEAVTATATVIPDSPLGFPMDELYAEELRSLRDRGARLCEVSMLASSMDLFSDRVPLMLNAKKMFLVFFLFRHIFDYVKLLLDVDYICITVNPKHANTYDTLLFQDLGGGLKFYGKVNGAPAVAKYLDVKSVDRQCVAAGRKSIHKMFLAGQTDPETFSAKINFTPEDLRYFFVEKVNAFQSATAAQMAYLRQCYPNYNFSEICS
ncbi:MAG TPA: hypothetical protein VLJ10_00230 [Candidatus Bathyarchaeia archaeon]|nr:hypothetical protein [Candidatus Bathyarchaeia archaeon]